MRFTDWFLVIPFLPLAIVLASILGRRSATIIFVIGVTSWPSTARVVRAQVLSVKTRPYVERARALGASDWHLITRHILPNVVPLIFANTILIVAVAILSETTLSFLGLGDPLHISWGTILEFAFNDGRRHLRRSGGGSCRPGLAIVLVVLAFTMCGYALDDILNPKLQGAMSRPRRSRDLHVTYQTQAGPVPAVRGDRPRHRRRARSSASPASRGAASRRSPAALLRLLPTGTEVDRDSVLLEGEDVLAMKAGSAARGPLDRGVDRLPGRDARDEPGPADRRPDRRGDHHPRTCRANARRESGPASSSSRSGCRPGASTTTRTSSRAGRGSA